MTYYSLGVTISFCKCWFENDTSIQIRYCHLLGIWYVFIVDMLFSSLFYSAHKIYVDIYLNRELSLKAKSVMLMMFSTDLGNTFTFKCFLQFTCTNLDGSQKERVTLNLLQNKGGTQKEGRGVPTLEETMDYHSVIIEFFWFAKLQFRIKEKINTKCVQGSKWENNIGREKFGERNEPWARHKQKHFPYLLYISLVGANDLPGGRVCLGRLVSWRKL